MKKHRILAALSATFLSLAACSPATESTGNAEEGPVRSGDAVAIDAPMPSVPAGLEVFYNQKVDWQDCGGGMQCGQYMVPLDYENPKDRIVEIAATRRPATKTRIGSLLVNPGGPGGSGQEMATNAEFYFTPKVLDYFDVIGFDPRGVGESNPVDCVSDAELGTILERSYPNTPEADAQSQQDLAELAQACDARSGDMLPFIGTESAARDMDVIRHVEGDPKLYYVGFSYGTSLGGEYAELFPKNVGRMVLDGATAPDATSFDQTAEQLKGFEQQLDAYLESCLGTDGCPFSGSVEDARAQIKAALDQALVEPYPTATPDRPLTQAAMLYGIITPLYSEDSWPSLTQAFDQLLNAGDGSVFQLLFDAYTGRDGYTFNDNSVEANYAINCADYGSTGTPEEWAAQRKQLEEMAPLFGPVFGYNDALCAGWAFQTEDPLGPFVAEGSDPIVVVGTVGDPATPYEWAVKFADTLSNAVLITYEGNGHTAYGRSTECVSDPIDKYLINGTVPEALTCPAE